MIEDRIKSLTARIDTLTEALDDINHTIEQGEDTMARIMKEINTETLRLNEANLLRDIRDGKLTVLHSATGEPVKLAFIVI